MVNIIDGVVLFLLLYYILRGYNSGFLRSILGPVSLVAGAISGYLYYLKTDQVVVAFLICIISPFIIHFVLSILLRICRRNCRRC